MNNTEYKVSVTQNDLDFLSFFTGYLEGITMNDGDISDYQSQQIMKKLSLYTTKMFLFRESLLNQLDTICTNCNGKGTVSTAGQDMSRPEDVSIVTLECPKCKGSGKR